jgi:hypothetical protein
MRLFQSSLVIKINCFVDFPMNEQEECQFTDQVNRFLIRECNMMNYMILTRKIN